MTSKTHPDAVAAQGLSLEEVARLTGGRVVGDGRRRVSRVLPLDEAGPGDLSLLASPRYREEALASSAGALLVRPGLEPAGRDLVVVADPHMALKELLPRLAESPPAPAPGVSPQAAIAQGVTLGEGVGVGPFAVLEAGVKVADRARIGAGCYVGVACEIGEDTLLHPQVTLYARCRLGRRVIVHAGAVIGSDGFGYATRAGAHEKIPQVGHVEVGDDVEIGAGVTIDRGSIGRTVIGAGTKIDNLVQIAHNVRIGEHCLIVAQTGLSGSTRLGDGVVFAGQSGAAGHLTIGAGARVASKSAVYEDLPAGAFVAGIPAVPHMRWKRAQALIARLPEIWSRLRELERTVAVPAGRRAGRGKKT